MAKKSKNNSVAGLCLFVACGLAVLTFIMMFLSAVVLKVKNADDIYYAGSALAFGKTLSSASVGNLASGSTKINASFGLILAYLLPLIVAVVALVVTVALKKNSKLVKLVLGLVLTVSFVLSAILIICTLNIASVTGSASSIIGNASSKTSFADLKYSLAYGSIIAIITSALGAVASLGYTLLK